MRRLLPASLALSFLFAAMPAGAQQFTLEREMSSGEFAAAGLDKLSPQERASLDAWLRREFGLREEQAREEALAQDREDRRGLFERDSREPIESRLPGTFSGVRGPGFFHLENGQVWERTGSETLTVRPVENPKVTIKPGMISGWYLQVDGYGTTFKVRRVE